VYLKITFEEVRTFIHYIKCDDFFLKKQVQSFRGRLPGAWTTKGSGQPTKHFSLTISGPSTPIRSPPLAAPQARKILAPPFRAG
jgi:hypothetical protein